MIKYLTKSGDLHVLQMLDKSVTVKETPPKKSYNDSIDPRQYDYEGVTVYDNYDIYTSHTALSTIVVAIELVREVKRHENQTRSG